MESDERRNTAYVALGSNQGDRIDFLASAARSLAQQPDIHFKADSGTASLYESDAVGPVSQPRFLNSVVRIATTIPPRDLLGVLLAIERSLGRVRREPWGPRTIDLDLLLYGAKVVAIPELTVPHPRMHQRLFVLMPLVELAPNVKHPVSESSIRTLLARELADRSIPLSIERYADRSWLANSWRNGGATKGSGALPAV